MKKQNARNDVSVNLLCLGVSTVVFLFGVVLLTAQYGLPAEYAVLIGGVVCFTTMISVICLLRSRHATDPELLLRENGDALTNALYDSKHPILIVRQNGRISWCNAVFKEATGKKTLHSDELIENVSGIRTEQLLWSSSDSSDKPILVGGKLYSADVRKLSGTKDKYLIELYDCTAFLTLQQDYRADRTVIAYIAIDNIEEISQFVDESFARTASGVEERLRKYIGDRQGVFRAYDKNKYMALLNKTGLDAVLSDRFGILDEIRSFRVGDGISVTISIGVSDISGTLAERAVTAEQALDLALQRGGDQAVYRSDAETRYFGGKTKAIYKRTNVRARVMAEQIMSLIARSGNILVMGHKFGDFDSFAAAVGMARLAMNCGVRVNITVNRSDPAIRLCFDKMTDVPEYKNIFIDGPTAMDRIRPDTLLILVDVNNFEHAEYPPLVRNVRDIVVIDHHRRTEEFSVKPLVSYIESSASSASEMVAGILEQVMASHSLLKEEAELLMSGILLDTKRFTRNTGTHTFGAALYLRGEGADPSETEELFKSEMDDVVKEAHFHTNVHIYRDVLAISVCEEEADASYRVVAAKAADELLKVKNIEASFALVKIEDKVHISARSAGRINVQVILEALHGGGHFDVAGAQLEAKSVREVAEMLKEAIDGYMDKAYPDVSLRDGKTGK